jgi:hypothetical protein
MPPPGNLTARSVVSTLRFSLLSSALERAE